MATSPSRPFARKFLPVLLAGVGIGWIVGLSETPVVQGVLTVLLAFVLGVTTLILGVRLSLAPGKDSPGAAKAPRPWQGNPWPAAALVIGVAIGSTVGLAARGNGWVVRQPIAEPDAAGVRQPTGGKLSAQSPLGLKTGPLDRNTLRYLQGLPDDELLSHLSVTHDPFLEKLFTRFAKTDPKSIVAFIKEMPCPEE